MAHYMWYSKKRVDAKEENSHRENIMKAWKDYTIEDAIIVIEKAVKVIKLEMLNACWQNCAWYCSWLHTIQRSQLINYERLVNVAKNNKAWGEEFQNVDLEEIKKTKRYPIRGINRRLLDGAEHFQTNDKEEKNIEEAVLNRKQIDIRQKAEGLTLLKIAFNFFYD